MKTILILIAIALPSVAQKSLAPSSSIKLCRETLFLNVSGLQFSELIEELKKRRSWSCRTAFFYVAESSSGPLRAFSKSTRHSYPYWGTVETARAWLQEFHSSGRTVALIAKLDEQVLLKKFTGDSYVEFGDPDVLTILPNVTVLFVGDLASDPSSTKIQVPSFALDVSQGKPKDNIDSICKAMQVKFKIDSFGLRLKVSPHLPTNFSVKELLPLTAGLLGDFRLLEKLSDHESCTCHFESSWCGVRPIVFPK